MDNKVADIISKSVMGEELAPDDSAYLNQWISKDENNKREYELLTGIKFQVKVPQIDNYKPLIFNNIIQLIQSRQNRSRNLWFAYTAAASIIIAFFIGGYAWNYLPGSIFDTKKIVYNEMVVPAGAKSALILSDGSKVWLNGGSKLRYPTSFSAKSREVQLEGEAFFDIAHNKSKPFIVRTNSIQIKVLGTAFNVKSYADDKTVETTLVRGLVEIREIKNNTLSAPLLIKPNQRAVFVKENAEISVNSNDSKQVLRSDSVANTPKRLPSIIINQVNTTPIVSWKEKALVFENTTFADIAVDLERWFGIKIHIKNEELKKYRYNGKFSHNETIYQVLEIIKVTTPIKYEQVNYEINIELQEK